MKKNKAIFLDRDGVINFERGFTYRLEDFVILPDVTEMLTYWRDQGYMLIIVSNQSGISRGLYVQQDVEVLHKHLTAEMNKHNIHFAEIYYCVHHPDQSKCICRKPNSLFIEKALARFNINPSQSYFIGDKDRDVQAGEKAGVKGILIEANSPLKNLKSLIK